MCSERALLALVFASSLGACAIPLDTAPTPPPPTDAGVATLPTCIALGGADAGVFATGRIRTLALGGGRTFVTIDTLHLDRAGLPTLIEPAAFEVAAALRPDDCLAVPPAALPAASALDVSALPDATGGRLLSVIDAGTERVAFVQAGSGFAVAGIALAAWDATSARFVADAQYLFTADRPAYGDAALVEGGYVYLYGCQSSGFLRDSCFVARAPLTGLHDRTAYEFYRAGGAYDPSPDEAWPLFDGGDGLTVVRRGARVYAAYVAPLGDVIELRAALGPDGPWSAPVRITRCTLPDGAFCKGLSALGELEADPSALWLGYGTFSFAPLRPEDARTRLVRVPLTGLP